MSEAGERVAVVGTTGWGTTLAVILAGNGHDVLLLARTAAEAETLDRARENGRHRPGLTLPQRLTVSANVEALGDASLIVLAVPSQTLAENLARIAGRPAPAATLLSAIKGIGPETGQRMSEIVAAHSYAPERVLALSGPNFAAEIAAGLPAATVIAGSDRGRAQRAQALLNGPRFRVYTSNDIVGVELGGALKNVIAIACGLSDGLGYGENAKAALVTRGLSEISRLGLACGAAATTFLGLAGIGDLVLSCESDLSRNRRLGLALAKGLDLDAARAAVGGVVEGAVTAVAVRRLAAQRGVEMPVCEALYGVLYEGKAPAVAGQELMARAAKAEFEGQPLV